MMRGDVCSDLDFSPLGLPDEVDSPPSAEVSDMDAGARRPGEYDVPGDHYVLSHGRDTREAQEKRGRALVHHPALAEVRVLAVVNDQSVQSLSAVQGLLHNPAVLDAAAVIREGDGSGGGQIGHVGEFLSGP